MRVPTAGRTRQDQSFFQTTSSLLRQSMRASTLRPGSQIVGYSEVIVQQGQHRLGVVKIANSLAIDSTEGAAGK
jgi:hypothetical protein